MKEILKSFCFLFFTFCVFSFPVVVANDLETQEEQTRKKISSSFVFGALSNACAQVGQIVGAETQKEKQQGALNLLSTAFAVASQAASKEETENKVIIPNGELVNSLKNLLDGFVCFLDKETKIEDFSLLAEFRELKTEKEKVSFLDQLILDHQKAKDTLKEIMHVLIDWLIDEYC